MAAEIVGVTCFGAVAIGATDVASFVGAPGSVLALLPTIDGFVIVAAPFASAQVQRVSTRTSVRHPNPHRVLRLAFRNLRQRRWCGNGDATGAGGGYVDPGYVGWPCGFVYIASLFFTTTTTSIFASIVDISLL